MEYPDVSGLASKREGNISLEVRTDPLIRYNLEPGYQQDFLGGVHLVNKQLKVVIVGTGYVGLTTGVCLAYLGHRVTCVDVNEKIISELNIGKPTIHEPGMEELMVLARNNLVFSFSLKEAMPEADIVVIAVGTPSKNNGDADISAVERVAEEIGAILNSDSPLVIVNKSTVPIGSARRVETVVKAKLERRNVECNFFVASNPEFLREGAAIRDTLYPDRIVVGSESAQAFDILGQLYNPILKQTFEPPAFIPRPAEYKCPSFIATNPTSAELIKYAANSFLAMKISFINEFAGLAERVGADIKEVAQGIGLDKRIGLDYLQAGLGWGGSCFGKDTRAISYTASQYGYKMELVQSTIDVNYRQRMVAVEKLQKALKVLRGSIIGILGLSFKPNTDDLRDAPSVDIINKLIELGARVRVFDPVAMPNFQRQFKNMAVEYCEDVITLSIDCDALVLVTEWHDFAKIDWSLISKNMRQKIIVDGRNFVKNEEFEKIGFNYFGMGRF
ncbi:UDP-glucose/GDP-mannose dehydrogenase family protein [Patescibacteria group bacterium]|nr:UDP-glucose/GDP-mannose dehydrogenase family protein [Patescibacteria group bacterium]